MSASTHRQLPLTQTVQRALTASSDAAVVSDLLFLEAWEMHRPNHLGATLRAAQIRRANPDLAAAIQAELAAGRGR